MPPSHGWCCDCEASSPVYVVSSRVLRLRCLRFDHVTSPAPSPPPTAPLGGMLTYSVWVPRNIWSTLRFQGCDIITSSPGTPAPTPLGLAGPRGSRALGGRVLQHGPEVGARLWQAAAAGGVPPAAGPSPPDPQVASSDLAVIFADRVAGSGFPSCAAVGVVHLWAVGGVVLGTAYAAGAGPDSNGS